MNSTVKKFKAGDRVEYFNGEAFSYFKEWVGRRATVVDNSDDYNGTRIRFDDYGGYTTVTTANLRLIDKTAKVSTDNLRERADKMKQLADLADELGYTLVKESA